MHVSYKIRVVKYIIYLRNKIVEGHDGSSDIKRRVQRKGEIVGKVVIFFKSRSADAFLVSRGCAITVNFLIQRVYCMRSTKRWYSQSDALCQAISAIFLPAFPRGSV
jgi:hypothetical protein